MCVCVCVALLGLFYWAIIKTGGCRVVKGVRGILQIFPGPDTHNTQTDMHTKVRHSGWLLATLWLLALSSLFSQKASESHPSLCPYSHCCSVAHRRKRIPKICICVCDIQICRFYKNEFVILKRQSNALMLSLHKAEGIKISPDFLSLL